MASFDQERILRDNRRISIQLEQIVNNAVAPWGLTAAQTQVLLHVLRHSDRGTTLTQIHREFGYSMPALERIVRLYGETAEAPVKRLKDKGFIRSEHWEGDDRRKLLFATPSALALQQRLDRSSDQVRQQLCRCFTPQELYDLDRLQRKLLSSLSALSHQAKEEPTL